MTDITPITETGAKLGDRVVFHDANGRKEPGKIEKIFSNRAVIMAFDSDGKHYQVSANKVELEHDNNN